MNGESGLNRGPLENGIEEFLAALSSERGLSNNTVAAYRRDLNQYSVFLDARVPTPDLVSAFAMDLYTRELAPSSIARKLAAVRSLHRFLVAEGMEEHDPTQLLATPKLAESLPKAMTVDEVARLLDQPTTTTAAGRRDQAILEFMYGTGCRVGELVALDQEDLDLEAGTAIVTGKGSKQRLVPLGRYAVEAILAYLPDRLALRQAGGRDSGALFLNRRGKRLTRQGVWGLVKKYANSAGLGEEVSPHALRHSAATHMVEGGADLRSVQEILGHATIRTTQVYTRVSPQHVREVYVTSHPRGR